MPSLGRTGADVALFNLIEQWDGKGFEMAVACRFAGELIKQLPTGVPAFVQENWGRVQRASAQIRRRFLNEEDSFITSAHRAFRPDIWYVNTILQPEVVRLAKMYNIPCILHTHELEQMLSRLSESETRTLVTCPQLIIACSQAAREVFSLLGRRDNIEVCYNAINPERIRFSREKSVEIRKGLGIADSTFVWAHSGGLDSNKNQSRLVEIVARMLKDNLDVHFILLGAGENGYGLFCHEKARALGIEKRMSFLGARADDYYDHLNAADALVVTSFYESFSIATVEAAYLGKPVVAFDCGGITEIIRDRMGTVVNSWDSSNLIQAMVALMKGQTPFDAAIAKERVREFYVEVQGARWLGLLRKQFAPQAAVHS